jgi:hypothetical protein
MRDEEELTEDIADQKVIAARGPEKLASLARLLLKINREIAEHFKFKKAVAELDDPSLERSELSRILPPK